ncbi:hypothetical protein ACH4SP_36060 [Streptomyces sp. NPDC021093]|uniref:hypothetical protein n=1 Tax=Streptomyces sp. NPDC021093 TaxID=3365112 RepID=UPI0037B6343C
MRQGRTRRRAHAAAPVAALLLAGCGIQETDVIEAGGPAHVQTFVNTGDDALLFFRLPHGELAPVPRPFKPTGAFGEEYRQPGGTARRASTEWAVSALLGGPGKADRAAGLGTSLPRVAKGGVRVRLTGDESGDKSGAGSGDGSGSGDGDKSGSGSADKEKEVVMTLPLALGRLDATAVRQLICTAAYSRDRDGRATVRMTGQDGVSASGTCGLDPGTG